MDSKEINALISLLDDTDEEVVAHVTKKLLSYGEEVLPLLEDRYLAEPHEYLQVKIHELIERIHNSGLKDGLFQWAVGGGKDLFEGIFLIARYRYPELKRQTLNNQLDKIKLDAWLELNFQLASLDKVRILNYIFFELYGFKGDTEDYHSPDNSFINRVLETRKGNPISLAIVYSIVAQRLNIPIFGVNLPQHFILAYKDDTLLPPSTSFKGSDYLDFAMPGEILFYINTFNKGALFNKWNIDQFLRQLNIKAQHFYYEPCSNIDIVMRVCRNLIYSYEKQDDMTRAEEIKELLAILQPYGTIA